MKRVFSIVIVLTVIIVSLCSCGSQKTDDNKTTEIKADRLIGTWYGEVNGMTSTYTFEEGGVGTAINNAGTEIPFTYKVVDDTSIDFEYNINGEKVAETSTYKIDGDTLTLDEVEFVKQ